MSAFKTDVRQLEFNYQRSQGLRPGEAYALAEQAVASAEIERIGSICFLILTSGGTQADVRNYLLREGITDSDAWFESATQHLVAERSGSQPNPDWH